MNDQTETTLPPVAPAIEAPRRRKRTRRRIPDGAKSGRLVPTRTLSGPDRAKLAEFRATLDREIAGWQDRLTAQLGHASVDMTVKVYGSHFPAKVAGAVDALADALTKPRGHQVDTTGVREASEAS